MGKAILGWVEVKVDGIWTSVIELDNTIDSNSYMFKLLFDGFRGTPDDHSDVMVNWGEDPSWIAWDEVKAIDWSLHERNMGDDWRQLFEMMNLYSQVPVVTDVRLIVSFW